MQTENAVHQSQPTPAASGPDSLPPVSPPTPGFIMQLFVIPLIIVALIVGVWLLIHWVVNRDMRPAELAKDIERLNHASWQQALTLANQLRDEQGSKLRGDHQLCTRLAHQLQRRIDEGGTTQEQVWLRIYLCRALGEFELTDGVPTLITAVRHHVEDGDLEVQRAGLQALIYLKNKLSDRPVWAQPEVLDAAMQAAVQQPLQAANMPVTIQSAAEPLPLRYDRLHSTAAFLLGMLDDPRAAETLAKLLADHSTDVRYNAAVGLARHGDPRCQPTLVEMLDANRVEAEQRPATGRRESFSKKEMEQWSVAKREMIVANALRSAEFYAQRAAPGDASQLIDAVRQVSENATFGPELVKQATEILPQLRKLESPVGSSP